MNKYKAGNAIENPKKERINKHIVRAYKNMVAMQEEYHESLKNHAPSPPVDEGDYIYYKKENQDKWKSAKVLRVKYDPYTYSIRGSFGGWDITVEQLNNDFSEPNTYRNHYSLVRGVEIKEALKNQANE